MFKGVGAIRLGVSYKDFFSNVFQLPMLNNYFS